MVKLLHELFFENDFFESAIREMVEKDPGLMFCEAQVTGNSGSLYSERSGLIILEALAHKKIFVDYESLTHVMPLNKIVNAINFHDDATIEIWVNSENPIVAWVITMFVKSLPE